MWGRRLLTLLTLFAIPGGRLAARAAADALAPWTIDDALAVRTGSDPQTSPDGARVAFVLRSLRAGGVAYESDVWLVTVATGTRRRLTTTGGAAHPRWSPDGRVVAFLSPGAAGGPGANPLGAALPTAQVWSISADGGEASPLTRTPRAITAFEWSPGGDALAYLANESSTHDSKSRGRSRLWWFDLATRRTAAFADGGLDVREFSLAPEGERAVISARPSASEYGDAACDLHLVSTSWSGPKPLVRQPGADVSPRYSPDGRSIAFVSQRGRDSLASANRVPCQVSAAGGVPQNLCPRFDGNVARGAGAPVWSHDGRILRFVGRWRTSQHIFEVVADSGLVRTITRSAVSFASPSSSADDSTWAFLRSDAEHPPEIWVKRPGEPEPRALTDLNPQVREHRAFRKQVLTWAGAGGASVEGLLLAPVDESGKRPAPLFVLLHDEPDGAHGNSFTPGEPAVPIPQLLQSGWAVLLPNPHGSDGYGERFRSGTREEMLADVEAGVDQIAALGLVDSTRVAIGGETVLPWRKAWLRVKTAPPPADDPRAQRAAQGRVLAQLARWTPIATGRNAPEGHP